MYHQFGGVAMKPGAVHQAELPAMSRAHCKQSVQPGLSSSRCSPTTSACAAETGSCEGVGARRCDPLTRALAQKDDLPDRCRELKQRGHRVPDESE